MVTIVPCHSKKDFKLFEEIPERLHGRHPQYVPPFPGSVAAILDRRHPFHRHGEILPFLAFKGGRPVGRAAAIVNEAHNRYHHDKLGFFGFVDFDDDHDTAGRLFEVVDHEIARRGRDAVRGPYNPTSNDECGVLVEGFDTPPFVMMPYNPPFYAARYEELGLTRVRNLLALYVADATQGMERTRRIVERVKERARITIRHADMSRIEDEVAIMHRLFNATLGQQWGFVPISREELDHAVGDLKAVLDPEMVLFAERNGEPIGVSVSIPNINEFLLAAKSSKGIFRILRFLWYLKTRRPKETRMAILGVLPDHRNKGVAPAFYFESLARGRERYTGGEISWVLDVNAEVLKAAELMGATPYKTYAIYEKSLTA